MILDLVDYGYVVLVELLRYSMKVCFFIMERCTVWVGAPLYYKQGLLGKDGLSQVSIWKLQILFQEGRGLWLWGIRLSMFNFNVC